MLNNTLIMPWHRFLSDTMPKVSACQAVVNCEKTWIVGKLTTPTVDFYFRSRQADFEGYQEVDVNTLLSDPSHPFWSAKQDKVILIRDVPIELLKRLVKQHEQRHVVWFTDDDIPRAHRDDSLPKQYKNRLAGWYRKAKPTLSTICTDIWVSTKALAETYGLPDTSVLPPLQLPAAAPATVRCFYHGSSSHTLEWAFVIKLIALIQQKYSYTWFELIGDHTLYRQVRHIPRVTVLHPMSWDNYQAHISSRSMDIGLAPLFESTFNQARSHTKLLDIQRQGAVGIYSKLFPNAYSIKAENAGIVADNDIASWLVAFDQLLTADRDSAKQNAQRLINQLSME